MNLKHLETIRLIELETAIDLISRLKGEMNNNFNISLFYQKKSNSN